MWKPAWCHWCDWSDPWMLRPCLHCLTRCLLPLLYTFCLCAISLSLSLSTSLPLHLQFQPSVQLVGRGSQEACSGGSTRECQVQRTHCSDSAVHQEEEQHPAAAAQWQEQSLWFPQWGVSDSKNIVVICRFGSKSQRTHTECGLSFEDFIIPFFLFSSEDICMNLILLAMECCKSITQLNECGSTFWHWLCCGTVVNMNQHHVKTVNLPHCFKRSCPVFVSFSTRMQFVCKCDSANCFSVPQNTSC